jgi:hypothetical protein
MVHAFPARLHVLLASQARRGVVFRRGPVNAVCTVGWNLETDKFELGQWLRGRIYERRGDLSPTAATSFTSRADLGTILIIQPVSVGCKSKSKPAAISLWYSWPRETSPANCATRSCANTLIADQSRAKAAELHQEPIIAKRAKDCNGWITVQTYPLPFFKPLLP